MIAKQSKGTLPVAPIQEQATGAGEAHASSAEIVAESKAFYMTRARWIMVGVGSVVVAAAVIISCELLLLGHKKVPIHLKTVTGSSATHHRRLAVTDVVTEIVDSFRILPKQVRKSNQVLNRQVPRPPLA